MTRRSRQRGVEPSGEGRFKVRLPTEERAFLRSLGPQMKELLASPEPDGATARLFPVAYPTDDDRQTEYRLLVHGELEASHRAALTVLEESSDATELTEDQVTAWMRAVNQVRLVLGTRLGVTEEGTERPLSPDHPLASTFGIYDYLTWLQDEIVDALSAGLPGG